MAKRDRSPEMKGVELIQFQDVTDGRTGILETLSAHEKARAVARVIGKIAARRISAVNIDAFDPGQKAVLEAVIQDINEAKEIAESTEELGLHAAAEQVADDATKNVNSLEAIWIALGENNPLQQAVMNVIIDLHLAKAVANKRGDNKHSYWLDTYNRLEKLNEDIWVAFPFGDNSENLYETDILEYISIQRAALGIEEEFDRRIITRKNEKDAFKANFEGNKDAFKQAAINRLMGILKENDIAVVDALDCRVRLKPERPFAISAQFDIDGDVYKKIVEKGIGREINPDYNSELNIIDDNLNGFDLKYFFSIRNRATRRQRSDK